MSWIGDVDWDTTPAGIAPAGQTSHLVHPLPLDRRITVSNAVCVPIVAFTLALRLYTRMHIVRGLRADDYAIILAVVVYGLLVATLEILPRYGLGRHVWNISLADFSPYYLLGRVFAAVFYTVAMFLIKISLLMLYRRVFDISSFYKRWWFVMIYTISHSITATAIYCIACRPVASQWDLHIKQRKCIDMRSLIAIPVFHCINDLLILALPLPLVLKLTLSSRRKTQVALVFGLGSASCIVSILRLYPIYILVQEPRYGDVTWRWTPVAIWTQVETTFCMVCASVPVLKPLMSRHFPTLFPTDGMDDGSAAWALPRFIIRSAGSGQEQRRDDDHASTPTSSAPSAADGHMPRPGMVRCASSKTIGRISTRDVCGLKRWVHEMHGRGDSATMVDGLSAVDMDLVGLRDDVHDEDDGGMHVQDVHIDVSARADKWEGEG